MDPHVEESPALAFRTAAGVMTETVCAAVKLEGGTAMAETIRFPDDAALPVMPHIGLTPQTVNALSSYAVRSILCRGGVIMRDAQAVGGRCVQCGDRETSEPIAPRHDARVAVPTIGIGASAACDELVLVADDLIGLFSDFRPQFVHRSAEIGQSIEAAIVNYAAGGRTQRSPPREHVFQQPRQDWIAACTGTTNKSRHGNHWSEY